ncbi:MAG: type III pantothenate kinase [Gammaproteobacteria bacterium]|nr:type III pantothenate kinase [Gammaproteobacteria bacterium]
MITVADIGNSYLKIARWDGRSVRDTLRVRHRDLLDSDWQAALDAAQELSREGVFVASVAGPGAEQVFEAWLLKRGHDRPVFLKSSAEACGVRNAYSRPESLGIDRWCAMIAARKLHQRPLCIVDAGTAVTVDWVDKDGLHRGGMIMPGPNLQADSLFSNTRHLHESSAAPSRMFADNTSEGIAAGVCNACSALVDRACCVIEASGEGAPTLVLTGGESSRILPLLARHAEVHDDLVLRGVALLAEEQRG